MSMARVSKDTAVITSPETADNIEINGDWPASDYQDVEWTPEVEREWREQLVNDRYIYHGGRWVICSGYLGDEDDEMLDDAASVLSGAGWPTRVGEDGDTDDPPPIDNDSWERVLEYCVREANRRLRFRIVVDHENNAETWWDAARRSLDGAPDLVRRVMAALDDSIDDEVIVDGVVLDEFWRWAARLPGWNDGPEHARHPLLQFEIEDGEDEENEEECDD